MSFSLLLDTSLYILLDHCQQVAMVLWLVLHVKNKLLEVTWNVNHLQLASLGFVQTQDGRAHARNKRKQVKGEAKAWGEPVDHNSE